MDNDNIIQNAEDTEENVVTYTFKVKKCRCPSCGTIHNFKKKQGD